MKRIHLILASITALFAASATAADVEPPRITDLHGLYHKLSDNGKWAVSEKGSETDGSIELSGGTLINLETMTTIDLPAADGVAGVGDVTDNGSVVGMHAFKPAFWSSAEGWVELPTPKGFRSGYLSSVTPDGKLAVGYVTDDTNIYQDSPVLYDLEKRVAVDMPNLPTLDMNHENMHQMRAVEISSDGRYILCNMSFSYVMPTHLCSFVYDRENSSYKMIGFTEDDKNPWKPDVENVLYVDSPCMSTNGQWIGGSAYIVEPAQGSEFGNEYTAAFRYEVATGKFEVFSKAGESDHMGCLILNDGTLITGNPAVNPYRFANIRYGDYYIPLENILRQIYGINFEATTGFQNTGTAYYASADGLTMIFGPNPENSYVIRFNEPVADAASKVNLLSSYTVNPPQNSIMTRLGSFTITFDRDVEINGSASAIKCLKEDGTDTGWTPLSSGGWIADGHRVTLAYRGRDLEEGQKYTITIPEGRIRIKGDNRKVSPEIKISFTGRANEPVKITAANPEDGASVAGFDLTANPLLLTFNANLKLTEGAKGYLWRTGEDSPFCDMTLLCANNQMLAYPISAQHLYNGTEYKVVIPAGSVTDISGAGANEEITLTYKGSYVRVLSPDDKYIFKSDCSDLDDFIFYDGDKLQPANSIAAMGFTKDTPWWFVRESETSTDMALAAHSMFANGGTSDDWMSTPQLFIPDADCYLTFDAQSYLNSKTDYLKVYVYANSDVYNTFNKSIVDKILAEGTLVFNDRLSPGSSEENLSGDWRNVNIPLGDFAGKDVYIAFVNNNTDGSMVIIDNINVIHDLRFLTTFLHNDRVVAKESADIQGVITITSEIDRYKNISLVLKDGEGKELDRIEETGIDLAKGSTYPFTFGHQLPLTIGEATPYSVEITLDDYKSTVNGTIRCLSFQPAKNVVLEEFSGRECPNCPLGIIAAENLEKIYGDAVIPIVLRTYQSDPLGNGMGSYTSFLGLSAAPSGRINRGDIVFPMDRNDNDYMFSGENSDTWLDVVRKEMASPADAEIAFSSAYDRNANAANVSATVRSALNIANSPLNVFAVVVEDGLETWQQSNVYPYDDPDLGDFGKDGAYGSAFIMNLIVNDIARTAYGLTFNGTGGLIPSTMKAGESYSTSFSIPLPETVKDADKCKVIVMLIDPGTGRVINANRCPINGQTSSVSDIEMSGAKPEIKTEGGNILAHGCAISAYALDGTMLGYSSTGSLSLNGYEGVVIVKATAADGASTTAKVVM